MWLCHDNEVRATEACLSDWVIAWGLLPPPSFITAMIVFPLSFFPSLSLSLVLLLSICLSHFPFPVPTFAFAFVPSQLFINTWWMLPSKKVSLKSFSLWVMNIFCNNTHHTHHTLFFWLHGYNKVFNAGHLSDTHSLLSADSIDVTQSWAPAPPFTPEQPETFEYGQEIGVVWLPITIMSIYFTPQSRAKHATHALPSPHPQESDWPLGTG